MKVDPFLANRAMWNETAGIHAKVELPDLLEAAARDDFSTFDHVELRLFGLLRLAGKSIAQLCCNNARELISAKKAGAGRCVGFDFSEAFLHQGRRIAKAAKVEIELVNTDVNDIAEDYSGRFDIVYVTVGSMGWLPDVSRFFATAARLLQPGGHLFLYDMHPALFLYDEEKTAWHDPRICRSYFQREPVLLQDCPDYFDPKSRVKSPSYWHQHTLGEVLSCVMSAGLTLTHVDEYPHDVSGSYAAFEGGPHAIPMSYSLLAKQQSS